MRFTDSKGRTALPSAQALGYSLSVRFADEDKSTFEAKQIDRIYMIDKMKQAALSLNKSC